MNALLAAVTFLGATLAMTPGTSNDVDVAQIYEDVRVVRRVATVAGDDLPREILTRLVDENIARVRGRENDRNYAWAAWTRTEGSRVTETETIKKEKNGESTIVQFTAPSAHRLEITAPPRRYVAARNRPIELESVIAEYTTAAGRFKSEEFELAQSINPSESAAVDFSEIGWNVTVRLKAKASQGSVGNGTVELALIAPTLVDDPSSPHAGPAASLLAMKPAIRNKDVLEIRRLCDAITAEFDAAGKAARNKVAPVGGATRLAGATINPDRLYAELQRIEDLLTGDEQQRRDGMDKLHQMVIYLRP